MRVAPWMQMILISAIVLGVGGAVRANEPGELAAASPEVAKDYGSPYSISPSAFRNIGSNPEAMVLIGNTGVLQAKNELIHAIAPVYLPDGATITSFHAAVYDGWDGSTGTCTDVVSKDVGVWLMRTNSFSGEAQQLTFRTSSGSSSSNQWLYDGSVDHPVIEQPEWSYYLLVRMCKTSHYLMGVHILYTMP